jgi:hypothetical protein
LLTSNQTLSLTLISEHQFGKGLLSFVAVFIALVAFDGIYENGGCAESGILGLWWFVLCER